MWLTNMDVSNAKFKWILQGFMFMLTHQAKTTNTINETLEITVWLYEAGESRDKSMAGFFGAFIKNIQ